MTAITEQAEAGAEHRLGVMLVAGSALGWSVSGVFARLIGVDIWTAVCLRSLFGALYMCTGLLVVHRGRSLQAIRSIGWFGIGVALTGAMSMISFIGAFFHTSVANVSVIYSTTPFLAAGLGWLVMREAVPRRTVIASTLALAGVAIMVSGSFVAGRLFGDGLAFVMALTFAVMAVAMRYRRSLEMLPTNLLVCLIAAGIAFPFSHPTSATPLDLVLLAGFAFTSIAFAFFMFLAGARRIPAAEAGLITTLEVVLSPLWVFLLFSENPGLPAIAGGAIVFLAVVWHIVSDRRAA
jgi:drug/metabolite transporter (DMT)-like permease